VKKKGTLYSAVELIFKYYIYPSIRWGSITCIFIKNLLSFYIWK